MFGKKKRNKDWVFYSGEGYLELFKLLKHCECDCDCPILIKAVKTGDLDLVYAIFESGFDTGVNKEWEDNLTPLMYAIKGGDIDMVLYLLACNAEIHLKTDDGITPLSLAQDFNRMDIVELLKKAHNREPIDFEKNIEPSRTVFEYRDEVKRGIKFLNEIGFDYSEQIEPVPLNEAITYHKMDLVNALLESDIDINQCDETYGQNAYSVAEEQSEKVLLERIIKHGGVPPQYDDYN